MKDYIIDLGLEFRLRIKLAVSNMTRLGKKNKVREAILVNCVKPPLLLPHPRPPLCSLFLALSAAHPPLLLCSSINAALKLNWAADFRHQQLQNPTHSTTLQASINSREFGLKFRAKSKPVSSSLGAELKLDAYPGKPMQVSF